MSDDKDDKKVDVIEALDKAIAKDLDLDRRKKAVQEKSLILQEDRVTRELDALEKNKQEIELAKTVNYGQMSASAIQELVKNNADYMEAARHGMTFINKEFKGLVPFFRKNLIVVCADTGGGKSTAVANIVYSTLTQKNPTTGRSCKILVLTNEEAAEDFYNRITCLIKGWNYNNHDQFTDEQRQTFTDMIPKLSQKLTIIGDVFEGVAGTTTTVEGIESVLNNTMRDENPYDLVLIDYYQNVRFSRIDPKLDEYNSQRKLCAVLDQIKMRYPAPIVVMAQIKRLSDEDDTTPFNIRLKGSKLICDKATFIIEVSPERDYLRSKWSIWKSRFTESVGKAVYTGYDRGKFVPYSVDFIKNAAKIVNKNLERKEEEKLGIPSEE